MVRVRFRVSRHNNQSLKTNIIRIRWLLCLESSLCYIENVGSTLVPFGGCLKGSDDIGLPCIYYIPMDDIQDAVSAFNLRRSVTVYVGGIEQAAHSHLFNTING